MAGRRSKKFLYRNENVGASDVLIDPAVRKIVYAALWESREGPWENEVFNGDGGGIFKSVDGGKTWRQLTKGLPGNIVQANIAISPSAPKTLFAAVRTKTISKLIARATAAKPGAARPTIRGPDLESAVVAISRWCGLIRKSADRLLGEPRLLEIDGRRQNVGRHGAAAPGGDDYQNVWINPK